MRIGIDGRLWSETGVGRYIRNLVYNLEEIDKKNEYVLFVNRGLKIKDLRFRNGLKIVEVDIRWHTLREQIEFSKILEKENLDLVHFPYFSVPIRYNKPYVLTIHDLIINHFPTGKASTLPFPIYQLKRQGYKFVLNQASKAAKKIIVPLNSVKKDVIKALHVDEDKVIVTTEGFDREIANVSTKGGLGENKYLLYVGNAYPHKNLERLIEAFLLFKKRSNTEVKLLLVGKNDYFYKKLSEKIEIKNISGVIIRNDVSDDELGRLYKNALALVSPSLMEGFGLPVLEAMALRCPVLASEIASFREVCEDSCIYFDPYSVDDMAEKLAFIYQLDKKTKSQIIDKGLRRSRQFSWKKMTEQTLKIYESCASL